MDPTADAPGQRPRASALQEAIRNATGDGGGSELAVQTAFFEGLFEDSQQALCLLAADGHILRVNGAFEEMFGFRDTECVGRDIDSLIVLPEEKAEGRELTTRVAGGTRVATEGRRLRKDGTVVDVAVLAQPVGVEGRQVGTYVIYQDITERRRTREALLEATRRAEEANQAKSHFLANMSHEIRTPLNAIIGMAELLAETELAEDQRKYVEVFRSAGQGLLGLINDVLDLSKIESGGIEIEYAPFRLDELFEEVFEVFGVSAHRKNLELVAHVSPEVPSEVVGDQVRVRQVLTNLLGNAIKFTDRGEVGLRATASLDPADLGGAFELRVEVWDTGCGIPESHLERIFGRFVQADAATTRKHGGSGLGLTISRRLADLMGGSLTAQSVIDQGSRFHFRVPLYRGEAPASRETAADPDLRGMRVLVVDDHETNRLILREILVAWGGDVREAPDGPTALALLEQAAEEGRPFGLSFLDGQMPGMDGFEVAREISHRSGLETTPLLMLTSLDRPGDIALSRELKMSGYMVKPVQRRSLARLVRRVLLAPSAPAAPAPAPPAAAQPRKPASPGAVARVLLVEDVPDNQLLVQQYLKKHPVDLVIASNGAEGLACFTADPGYDLVLMDIQMPEMDGHEATRAIRAFEQQEGLEPTPIVALTAHALDEEKRAILASGFTAHLTKPIRKADLLGAVAHHLGWPAP